MKNRKQTDKQIFFVCLGISITLFVGGFFCPPMGVIDGSVLKAAGILFAFSALAVGAQALANGKEVTIHKDDLDITVGDKDE